MSQRLPQDIPPVNRPLDRVARLRDAGAPIGDAIRIVIGGSIPRWAKTHDIARSPAQMSIVGRRNPPNASVVQALMKDLEATEQEIRDLLFDAAREQAEAAVA